MLFWFVATSVLTIHAVFRDPRFDHRPLIVGSLLPDLLDAPFGGARAFHSLMMAVGAMVMVMAITVGRRDRRKMLLGIPIGMLLHLVFDGAFNDTDVFWWPFTGSFGDHALPIVARGLWNIPLELVGLGLTWWCWKLFGLAETVRRERFLRTGQLISVSTTPTR